MPYSQISELPDHVRKKPVAIQKEYMATFNSVLKETGSEERAFKAANAILSKERKMDNELRFMYPITLDDESRDSGWAQFAEEIDRVHKVHGRIKVTEKKIDEAVRLFNESGVEKLVVDFRHGSDTKGADAEEGKAAGWYSKLEKRFSKKGKATLWGFVDWTKQAATYIRNKEYQFISPVLPPDEREGFKVLRAALTNIPFVHENAAIVLSGDIDLSNYEQFATEVISEIDNNRDHKHTTNKEVNQRMDKLKELAKKLELDPKEDWGDEEYAVAIEGHVESIKLEAKPKEKITFENKEYTKEDVIKLQGQVQEQGKDIKLMQAEKTADALVQDKKILPKERDHVIELAQESDKLLKSFLATREDGAFVKQFKEEGGSGPGKTREEGDMTATIKFQEAIKKLRREDKTLSYRAAMDQVMLEDKEQAALYLEEASGIKMEDREDR